MFIFTAYPGTIDENREVCLGLGGDLLQHSVGPDGSDYYRFKQASNIIIKISVYLIFELFLFYLSLNDVIKFSYDCFYSLNNLFYLRKKKF